MLEFTWARHNVTVDVGRPNSELSSTTVVQNATGCTQDRATAIVYANELPDSPLRLSGA